MIIQSPHGSFYYTSRHFLLLFEVHSPTSGWLNLRVHITFTLDGWYLTNELHLQCLGQIAARLFLLQ